jgi:hypothetical protein
MNALSRRDATRALVVAIAVGFATSAGAQPSGAKQYPDWSGQWSRIGSLAYPPDGYEKAGPPPLTSEYQAIWEGYQARKKEGGGPAGDPPSTCLPPGMPRIMTMSFPMEIIITPEVTYIYAEWDSEVRRVYTDGRRWSDDLELAPSFNGYSIGEWHDEDDDGVYDLLAIETRNIEGDRSFDSNSVPLAKNDSTVMHEKIRRVDESTLENEITTSDDALTRPWTVNRRYSLETEDPLWVEYVCTENNRHLRLAGEEWFFINRRQGRLDPTQKGQPRLVPGAAGAAAPAESR